MDGETVMESAVILPKAHTEQDKWEQLDFWSG